ncbi:hypothetical protein LJ725_23225 [Reyranella aquatilis]|uniref:Uncharacterized protein n=1 Tax=Reyranella aquatilis TaxID=2035356 RepID=A0ABS8L0R2_9HYPH|nr:hypothetical protein [Reyranella aquatilis]MCC8431897.1 hypothetical protein [Reyranella aquatilis]
MVYVLDMSPLEWDRITVPPDSAWQKLVDGVPLQQNDIPVEPRFIGRFKVPDISIPTQYFIFVSSHGREILDELAPGCLAYFPMELRVPASMQPAKNYWFVEVLSRAQLIDWDRSETVPRLVRAPDGRESRALAGRGIWGAVKFKAITPDLPPLWREIDVDRPNVNYFQSKWSIFMRDEFWRELDGRFPGQLSARKIKED